jgi:hypothetical protein
LKTSTALSHGRVYDGDERRAAAAETPGGEDEQPKKKKQKKHGKQEANATSAKPGIPPQFTWCGQEG